MRISDWSSDVCSSDLLRTLSRRGAEVEPARREGPTAARGPGDPRGGRGANRSHPPPARPSTGVHPRRPREASGTRPARPKALAAPQPARRQSHAELLGSSLRTEERRVGKDGGSKCRSLVSVYHYQTKHQYTTH